MAEVSVSRRCQRKAYGSLTPCRDRFCLWQSREGKEDYYIEKAFTMRIVLGILKFSQNFNRSQNMATVDAHGMFL